MTNHSANQLGHYQLLRLLGCGSFGEVYQAKHAVPPNRVVAIKLLKTSLASQSLRERFLAEARILVQLRHPHLVPLYEASVDGEVPYLVSEYAPGGSLKRRLDRLPGRSLAVEEAVRILQQVGQALRYVHTQGIVHHDLKPENILFDEHGGAVLADFGMIVLLDEAHRSSSPAPGTPTYMAPEQFQGYESVGGGRPAWRSPGGCYMAPEQFEGQGSKASDQYALGCIAYELVTGMRPFSSPPEVVGVLATSKGNEGTPIPPSHWNPDLTADAERAILKAMAEREEDRYTDVTAFVEALESALERGRRRKENAPELVEQLKESNGVYQMGPRSSSQSPDNALAEAGDPLTLVRHCITGPFVEKALDQLSWLERTCLLLQVDAGFLPQEIAGIVNASEQQVCEALEQGRERVLQAYYLFLEQEQILPADRRNSSAGPDDTHRIAALLESIPVTGREGLAQAIPPKNQSQPAEIDDALDPETILAKYDPYIVALVKSMVQHITPAAPREVFDLEVEDIVQQVRIKLWQVSQKRHIEHPKAYIRVLAQNTYRDLSRKRKPPLPLSRDEDSGSADMGVWTASEGTSELAVEYTDLADEFLAEELLHSLVSAILELPPRQKQAVLCSLKEHQKDVPALIRALKNRGIDIEAVHWPSEEHEKRLLKASLSAARKKMRRLGLHLEANRADTIQPGTLLPTSPSRVTIEN